MTTTDHRPPPPADPHPAPAAKAAAPVTATTGLPAANYMTEQEKDAANSAKQPYPTGSPPPPAETVTRSQGIKGVTDLPAETPAKSGPAPQPVKKEPG